MPDAAEYQNIYGTALAAIGSGGTLSGAVVLNGATLVGFSNAGTWTAAPLSWEALAAGTWTTLRDSGGVASTIANAVMILGTSTILFGAPAVIRGVEQVRIRAGLSGASPDGTAQTAARNIILLTRPVS